MFLVPIADKVADLGDPGVCQPCASYVVFAVALMERNISLQSSIIVSSESSIKHHYAAKLLVYSCDHQMMLDHNKLAESFSWCRPMLVQTGFKDSRDNCCTQSLCMIA